MDDTVYVQLSAPDKDFGIRGRAGQSPEKM